MVQKISPPRDNICTGLSPFDLGLVSVCFSGLEVGASPGNSKLSLLCVVEGV
jgi:hypothetical protein